MKLTIDFESRGTVDLKKVGVWPYAEHPRTQIMCLSLQPDHDLRPWMYIPSDVRHLYNLIEMHMCPDFRMITSEQQVQDLIDQAEIIEAHNVEFEVALWTGIMHRRFGFADIREEPYFSKLRCSASVAAMHNLPRALGKACEVLTLPVQKDADGHKLMMKLCKPRIPRKAEKEADPDWFMKTWYHGDAPDFLRQAQYCAGDTRAEGALSDYLGELPARELDVWRIDQRANWRGVVVDQELCHLMIAVRDEFTAGLVVECQTLTGLKPSQTVALKDWVCAQGVHTDDLGKVRVVELLEDEAVVNPVRRALEIRQAFAKTSLKKLDKALDLVCSDGRIRSTLMYHGAHTGRWTGKGMQLHNLPSRGLIEDIAQCTAMLRAGADLETLKLFYTDLQVALSSCIRGVLRSGEGKTLYSADFSAVEGRVLAWLAGDGHITQAYIDGLDMYKVSASTICGVPYDEVTKAQRGKEGKVSELAGGYGGGWRAYMAFAKQYQIKPPADIAASLGPRDYWDWWLPEEKRKNANRYTPKEAEYCKWFSPIVRAWRDNRPGTTDLWKGLEEACFEAIRSPGEVFGYAGIYYGVSKGFLQCRLPSGRKLFYYNPKIMTKEGKPQITYMGVHEGRWGLQFTYGGTLTAHVVSAIARDLMSEAMLRIDRARLGIDLLFTVHDEIIEEGPEGRISLQEFEELMSVLPAWAVGCPIEANGWIGEYYRK